MNQVVLQLPDKVVRKDDLIKLIAEFETLDIEWTDAAARQEVTANQPANITISQSLQDFITLNQLEISDSSVRSEVLRQLRRLRAKMPITHLTFASEVDQASLSQLVGWLRQNVDQQTVVEVGLQPGLIAGVYLRTTNRVYDYSMKSRLQNQRQLLVKELGALRGN